jgi:hypothetical protein
MEKASRHITVDGSLVLLSSIAPQNQNWIGIRPATIEFESACYKEQIMESSLAFAKSNKYRSSEVSFMIFVSSVQNRLRISFLSVMKIFHCKLLTVFMEETVTLSDD